MAGMSAAIADRMRGLSIVNRPSSARECWGGSVRHHPTSRALSYCQRAREGRRISRAARIVRRGYDGLAPEAARERGRLFLAGVGSGTVLFAISAVFDA